MIRAMMLFLLVGVGFAQAQDAEAPARPAEEVVETQGIKIWKRGKPTNAYTPIANESLMQLTWPEAQNRIAMGVKARKGNAAIVTSMIPAQRLDITQNTGINRLDGLNVRYTIIQLKP
jgi:ABC-type Fe3+ transport system substrate-binding protein